MDIGNRRETMTMLDERSQTVVQQWISGTCETMAMLDEQSQTVVQQWISGTYETMAMLDEVTNNGSAMDIGNM